MSLKFANKIISRRSFSYLVPLSLTVVLSALYSNCSQFEALNHELEQNADSESENFSSQDDGQNGNRSNSGGNSRQTCKSENQIQGNIDSCSSDSCRGWAFQYGQSSAVVTVRGSVPALHDNVYFELGTVNTDTVDLQINSILSSQGCLDESNGSSLLYTRFKFNLSSDAILEKLGPYKFIATSNVARLSFFSAGKQIGTYSYSFVGNSGEPAAPPPVVENKCEGDELVQGHLDSCDTTGCQGWGFRYGDIPTIKLVINQSGAYNRQVSLLTTPQSNRGDVNTQLKSQGCMSDSSDSLLTHFSIPAAEIDNKLRSTTPSKGAGTESYFKVSAYVNSKFIGESSYTPLSPIDLPPESANPPPQQAMTVSSGGLSVQNVPSGSLLGCFEYDKDYGIGNPPGSCGGAGKTQLIGNGWSYNSSTRTASCNCDSSVFGGRHGKIFFTYYPSLDNGRPGGISPIPIHAQGNF